MDEYQSKKDMDAYRRMYLEMLINVYNDILNREDYCYCINKALRSKNLYCTNKLKRHWEAIRWLIVDAKDSLCFEVLKLDSIQTKKVIHSILKKFNSDIKFLKFFQNYAEEFNSNR